MQKKTSTSKAEKFVAVRKNSDGKLCEFKSNIGKVYNYEMAIEAVEKGKIENASLFIGRDGKQHIRSKNDGKSKKLSIMWSESLYLSQFFHNKISLVH